MPLLKLGKLTETWMWLQDISLNLRKIWVAFCEVVHAAWGLKDPGWTGWTRRSLHHILCFGPLPVFLWARELVHLDLEGWLGMKCPDYTFQSDDRKINSGPLPLAWPTKPFVTEKNLCREEHDANHRTILYLLTFHQRSKANRPILASIIKYISWCPQRGEGQ